jgi:hypothetical protein
MINYQISVYRSAKSIALILDLEVVGEQLEEIVKWLQQTDTALSKMSIKGVASLTKRT